jgi:uncharacterized 2Fe-2S/4Fe-4S cluster protein (DUF4445 family)
MDVVVRFEPPGAEIAVPCGTPVLEAARRAGVPLLSTCGGRGTCGDCAVRVIAGEAEPPDAAELAALARAPEGVRLGCMLRATSDMTVRPVAALPVARFAVHSGRTAALAAVDLGTTTLSAVLLTADGEQLAESSLANPQRSFGGDVATRLTLALEGRGEELRALAMRGVAEVLSAPGLPLEGVTRIVVAGNTVMTHLALGVDASGLASHPYAGSIRGTVRTTAAVAGLLALPPEADLVFLPPMAAFVGGDVTADVLATALDATRDVRILLDLGTNAEVVVASGGTLAVASAAAGPAFEAAGLACGSPAQPGAVSNVGIRGGDLVLDIVGDPPARSLCGSGALSLVAALLDAGHIRADGRLVADGPLRARFHLRGDVDAVQVAGEPGGSEDVYLTQLDIRKLQLAKAAVATALDLTLRHAGHAWDEVAEVLVAGAFGIGVGGELLRRLGVIPSALWAPVTALGDAVLAGAALVALDPALEDRARDVAASAVGVDLASDPEFERTFLARTGFPAQA